MDTRHSLGILSLGILTIAQWTHEQSGYVGNNGSQAWAALWTSTHKVILDTITIEHQSACSRDQNSIPDMALLTRAISQLPPGSWLHWTIPIMEGQHFALNKIHFYSGYVNTCKTMICCLLHCYGIPHSIVSDQGTYFTTSKVLQPFKSPSIHWSNHVHYHPEAVGLKRMVE